MRKTVQLTAAVTFSLLLTALPAAAGERASIAMPFTSATPGAQAGLKLDLRYFHPDDPAAKPPVIQSLALHLPEGTRLDPAAVPACMASDAEIQLLGRDACPPESLVGTGKLDVFLGAPGDPQTTDLALFNGPGQILEVLLFEATNVTAALEHLYVDGTTIRADPAQVPPAGPAEMRVAASRIVWDVPARGAYLTTPPACPADGLWRTSGDFAFGDGGTATASFTQQCEGADLRVTTSPRTLVRGRRTRLKLRVLAREEACLAGATARIAGRRARTDAQGRASLLVRVPRRLLVALRVDAGRCGTVTVRLPTRR